MPSAQVEGGNAAAGVADGSASIDCVRLADPMMHGYPVQKQALMHVQMIVSSARGGDVFSLGAEDRDDAHARRGTGARRDRVAQERTQWS
ncbi:hypothetical protein GCM10009661_02140 [Catellatospora chokoriensis]|uniref:Uncharacterized protein n=1 Tax=Catellatospora chokoriensis TaxID=310353 RepID=A0A8J3JVU0_9ACTN|nr:hypothetical protein Cch02nite_54300 [Catellatospora chokoriensis]